MCLPVLIPGNGEDNPLCNIDSMVTNALQVFVDQAFGCERCVTKVRVYDYALSQWPEGGVVSD